MAAHLLPNPKITRIKPNTVVAHVGIISNSSMYGCLKLLRVRQVNTIVCICQAENLIKRYTTSLNGKSVDFSQKKTFCIPFLQAFYE